MVRAVPLLDLGDPLLERDPPAGRTGRQVAVRECLIELAVLERELVEVSLDSAHLSLVTGSRVVCHEHRDVFVTHGSDRSCAVHRMESGQRQFFGITDVMNGRRRDQCLSILRKRVADPKGQLRHPRGMDLPSAESAHGPG